MDEMFACSCKADQMAMWNERTQAVADEVCEGDLTRLATGVVYGLQRYDAMITSIPSDQWAAIEAETSDGSFRTRIQCDLIEHGLAATYLAFKEAFPNGGEPTDG